MELFWNLAFVHGCLFLSALGLIISSKSADRSQKSRQILFSAIIPLAGPAIAILVHASDKMKVEKPTGRYMGQSIDEGRFIRLWPF